MGLVNCPVCNKEISEDAVSCPNCGHPMKGNVSQNKSKSVLDSYKGLFKAVPSKFQKPLMALTPVLIVFLAFILLNPSASLSEKEKNVLKVAKVVQEDLLIPNSMTIHKVDTDWIDGKPQIIYGGDNYAFEAMITYSAQSKGGSQVTETIIGKIDTSGKIHIFDESNTFGYERIKSADPSSGPDNDVDINIEKLNKILQ